MPPKDPKDDSEEHGISPIMFKNLVGKGHQEFSTKKQQDAQEFFSHILNLVERNSRNELNPGESFKFKLEDRVQCSESKKVKYTHRAETVLSLNVPLEAAINKDEVIRLSFSKMLVLNETFFIRYQRTKLGKPKPKQTARNWKQTR